MENMEKSWKKKVPKVMKENKIRKVMEKTKIQKSWKNKIPKVMKKIKNLKSHEKI